MRHYLVHPRVVNNKFELGDQVTQQQCGDLPEALSYVKANLRQSLETHATASRKEMLQHAEVRAADSRTRLADIHDPLSDDADWLMRRAADETRAPSKMPMTLSLFNWNFWSCHFYNRASFEGKRFSLSIRSKDYDYDADLSNDDFNNRSTSVDMGKLVAVCICSDRPKFKGDWLWLFRDDKNLTNNARDGGNWNNCISSVACVGLSANSLIALVRILAGLAGIPVPDIKI